MAAYHPLDHVAYAYLVPVPLPTRDVTLLPITRVLASVTRLDNTFRGYEQRSQSQGVWASGT